MLGGLSQELLAAWDYFIHLAIILVPLFVVGSFLVGLFQEYLPPRGLTHPPPVQRRQRERCCCWSRCGYIVLFGVDGSATRWVLGAGAPLGIAYSFLLASPLINGLAVILVVGVVGVKITALYVFLTGGGTSAIPRVLLQGAPRT